MKLRRLARMVASLVALSSMASSAYADVYVTPKHLLILRQGLASLYGNYIFAVQNTGETAETLHTRVMLPKETVDFVPQEGVGPDELSLADGGIVVEKSFPPGVHIISIGFKVDARYGEAQLTLEPVDDIQSFTMLVPRDSGLDIESSALVDGDEYQAPDPQYRPYVSAAALKGGEAFTVAVRGVPEGRTRLWIVGAVLAGLLLIAAGVLALRTRPKLRLDDTGSLVSG